MKKTLVLLLSVLLISILLISCDYVPNVKNKNSLSGLFTVNSDGDQVKFARGNLFYDANTETYHLEKEQYSYSSDVFAHIGLFFWSEKESVARSVEYSDPDCSDSDTFFASDNFSVECFDNWSTLSDAEWAWLIGPSTNAIPGENCRESSTVNGVENARYALINISNSVNGMLVFPDQFEWDDSTMGNAPNDINVKSNYAAGTYSTTEFKAMEKAGCVFLPAAGTRTVGLNFVDHMYGYYLSSTPGSYRESYLLNFYFMKIDPQFVYDRSYGCSIRLVERVKE